MWQLEQNHSNNTSLQILRNKFIGNGNITGIGNSTPTIRGFCYKEEQLTPITSDSTVSDTGTFSTGAFTKAITGLTGNRL